MKKIILQLLLLSPFWVFNNVKAQTYTFTQSTGTFTFLTGGTSVNDTTIWNNQAFKIPIGFDFRYYNQIFDSVEVLDAWIRFDILQNYYVDVLWADMKDRGTISSLSPITYQLTGTAGSRILKIEWKNAGFVGDIPGLDSVNFQVWLYEGTNTVETHVGPSSVANPAGSYNGESGPYIAVLNNATGEHLALVGDSSNPTTATTEVPITGMPPNGKIFTFTHVLCNTFAGKTISITPGGPTTFCIGNNVVLDAGAGYTGYLWSPGNDTTQTITATTTGNYYAFIDSAGCGAFTNTVIVTVDIPPTTAVAGADQTVCATTATLAGNTPSSGTGTWTVIGSSTVTTPASPTSGVTGLTQGGSDTIVWTTSNGVCSSSMDTVIITADQNPTVAVAGADQAVCATTATLAGNNPSVGTGMWTVAGGSSTVTTPSSPTSGVTGLTQGGSDTIVWTISNGICPSSTDTVIITADQNPTAANAGPDQVFCNASTATLAGNTATVGTGMWTLVSGTGTLTTASNASSGVTGLGTGANIFRWTISNGSCASSSDDVVITRKADPNPVITASDTCLSTSLTLDAGAGYNSYSWSPGGATSQTLTVTTAGTYTVIVDSLGCTNNTSKVVSPCTGIGSLNPNDAGITVYPNPNTGKFIVEINGTTNENQLIEVRNIIGKLIYRDTHASDKLISIDIANYNKGIYLLSVTNSVGTVTTKLAVQ